MQLHLYRARSVNSVSGTLYIFDSLGYRPICVTLELPWKNNKRNISCIDDGSYKVKAIKHPKFGECLSVAGVIGRSGILVHAGNHTADTKGCVLAGSSFELVNEQVTIMSSRVALMKILDIVGSGVVDFKVLTIL